MEPEDEISSNSSVSGGNIKETPETPKFRCQAKTMALTYPQCDLSKEDMIEFLKSKYPIEHVAVCRERHADGGFHLHVYVRWRKKVDIKNAKTFDIKGFHPKIEPCRSPENWYKYIHKEDINVIEDFSFDFLSGNNFNKRKSDFDAWTQYLYKRKLDQTPLRVIDLKGMTFENTGKKRHICLVTDPDWGKTSWVENTFEGRAVYKVAGNKYPFDHYDGEPHIIFDDMIPPLQLLLNASNIYKTLTPVYGDTRYGVKYWPIKSERILILLLNDLPTYSDNEAFTARFNIIDLRTVKNTVVDQYDFLANY